MQPLDARVTSFTTPADCTIKSRRALAVGSDTLCYEVTCGRQTLLEEVTEGGTYRGAHALAHLSFTSYVLEPPDRARPVTFVFNGGPGSSSAWLHLGLFGPRRLVFGDPQGCPPTYAGLVDNEETPLTKTDLVFIDPMSTGYSRAAEGRDPAELHDYRRDVESVAEFIRLWVSGQGRWLSPKFVAGESYGTLRGAALTEHLQRRYGMNVNGLMLISSVLDLSSIEFKNQRNDRAHVLHFPTYAAIAHYHGRIDGDLRERCADAEHFAAREYPWALARGNRLSPNDRADIVSAFSGLTGLPQDFVDHSDLRIEPHQFAAELLKDQRLVIGGLDGRYVGAAPSAVGAVEDPFLDAVTSRFASGINDYFHEELGYRTDLAYEVMTELDWSFRGFEGRPVSVVPLLEAALRRNPSLKVHVSSGYYDCNTPYFAAEDVLASLRLPAGLQANIERDYYFAGHMMYVDEPSRVQQSQDLCAFIERSVAL